MDIKTNYLEAILWVLLSTGLFTIVFASAKFADGTIGTFQILLLRYVGAFATVVVLASVNGRLLDHRSKVPMKHLLRSILGCSAGAAITWSTARMPVADASAIGMLYGVMTVLLGIFFLREYVGVRQWFAVFVSLCGALFIMISQGAFKSSFVAIPALVALLSAVFMASEGLLIRVLSQTETALSMMLYISFFGICFLMLPAALEWKPLSFGAYASCLAIGPLSVLAQYCTIRGYRMAPLSVVGPVDYSWLIFAAILGVVVFGEIPDISIYVGGGLIVAGGLLLSRVRARDLQQ